jgi:NADPH-dependent curcumin reductase CurA
MTQINRRILLVSRPQGAMSPGDFSLVETPFAPLAEGQFRVRNRYLSIDPYMRGRMSDAKSYAGAAAARRSDDRRDRRRGGRIEAS